MTTDKLQRCIESIRERAYNDAPTGDPLDLMNWVCPAPEPPGDNPCRRTAAVCDLATLALAEVERLRKELSQSQVLGTTADGVDVRTGDVVFAHNGTPARVKVVVLDNGFALSKMPVMWYFSSREAVPQESAP